jgi:hypothetical protein
MNSVVGGAMALGAELLISIIHIESNVSITKFIKAIQFVSFYYYTDIYFWINFCLTCGICATGLNYSLLIFNFGVSLKILKIGEK